MSNSSLVDSAKATYLGNYKPAPIVLSEGHGVRVKDVEGREYLDFCGGIAVISVGHSHPALADAIAKQASRLMHVSNLFYNDRAIELAAAITSRTGFGRVFFSNSGTEANEAMLKLARRYFHEIGQPTRTAFVSTLGSFHGRTMGSLAITGQPKYHIGMGAMMGDVRHVGYGDLAALDAAIDDKTAGVILEPIQAEGGIIVPDDSYLRGARKLCDERGALLLFDEVQTGYGRTGRFLGHEWSGVRPDAFSLAKGIAGGFPFGAMVADEKLANALPPGSHASTFGGNALACAAALATLRIFDDEQLVAKADARGKYLASKLATIVEEGGVATELRGRGLLLGLRIGRGADPLVALAKVRDEGVLASIAGGEVLRFTPPLNVTEAEIDEAIPRIQRALASLAPQQSPSAQAQSTHRSV